MGMETVNSFWRIIRSFAYHVLCHVDQVVSRVHTWMVSPPWWPIWTEVLHATFSCFDRDADGAISLSELSNGHLLGALSMEDPRLNGENSDNFENISKLLEDGICKESKLSPQMISSHTISNLWGMFRDCGEVIAYCQVDFKG